MARHFSEFEDFGPEYDSKPISAWGYFGLSLLFAIPVIGLICLIVFSFSTTNINRRNYARSYFIAIFFIIIFVVVGMLTGFFGWASTMLQQNGLGNYMPWMQG